MKKLFLVDAYALIFRSYYAFIGRPMRNKAGMNTSAVFGFVKFLNEIIRREQPHYIGVAFDPPGGNFRHDIYSDYKANRSATPEDILVSTPYIKQILKAMRIPILELPGYEADDVIGTLSVKAAKEDFEVFMVTPDKDFGQLVQPCVYIYKQRKSGEGIEIIDMGKIFDHYGVDDPKLIIDVLALWGDASDNIPGVPGIGEKSAIKLVCEYGSVEKILENVSSIKGKNGDNIARLADQIMLAKQLATIETDVPINFEPEKLVMEEPDYEALKEIYMELGFVSLLKPLMLNEEYVQQTAKPSKAAQTPSEPDLFSSPDTTPEFKPQSVNPAEGTSAQPAQGDLFGGDMTPAYSVADDFQTIETTPHSYHMLTSLEDIRELAGRLSQSECFCFDTETAGFDVCNDRLIGLSFALKEFEAYYIPLPHEKERAAEILGILRPAFENIHIAKCAQNAKFDIMALKYNGVEVKGFIYDTMIIHYLIDPESRHKMDFLAQRYLNYSPIPIESLIGKGVKQISMDMVSADKVSEYAAEDADVTLRLKNILWPELEEFGLAELYKKMEEPLIKVLADMEMEGVRIDAESLKEYGKELEVEMQKLENEVRQMAEDPALNVNSAKQLGEILFGKMKIDPNAKRTKTKQYRTDEEYLQSLSDKHPIIGVILEYRGIKKLLSTYIDALPKLINRTTGKIHTSFNQAVTSTGRLSSNNPNLQNIPIRDEQGRMLRKAFIPEEGCLMVSADYSQVELRLMAHLSGDANMIDAFKSGKDIHSATAARLFSVAEEDVTSEQRRRAKTANFGIIYGISAFGLSQRLQIPRTEAKDIIDGYFATYEGVKRYMENCIEEAREKGYVSTIYGRKRYLADIRSSNANVRGFAERNAINAPIQGSAADIIKIAMIDAHRELKEKNLRSKLILQVHDELVLNVHPEELDTVREVVIRCMESAARLKVPLIAECGAGKNWLEAH